MTIYKSAAVVAGIMPDYSQAGVVICRTGQYTTVDDQVGSGDTIQMVPVPKNACILDIECYVNQNMSGMTGCHIGDGSSSSRFVDDFSMSDLNNFQLRTDGKPAAFGYCYDEGNDTIDLTMNKMTSQCATGAKFTMHVWYKMLGSISDEAWTGLVTT